MLSGNYHFSCFQGLELGMVNKGHPHFVMWNKEHWSGRLETRVQLLTLPLTYMYVSADSTTSVSGFHFSDCKIER